MANKKKPDITKLEIHSVLYLGQEFSIFMKSFEASKSFKVGDYLVAEGILYTDKFYDSDIKAKLILNSYGAPKKFKVVHIENELPFIKEIDARGRAIGRPFTMVEGLKDISESMSISSGLWENFVNVSFSLDPDYADSILLNKDYDPASMHKQNRQLWKEITDYNKSNRFNTLTMMDIINLFINVNVGDMLWSSPNGSYTVLEKGVSNTKFLKSNTKNIGKAFKRKGPYVPTLKVNRVINGKSSVIEIYPDYFHRKALYSQRPRSYNEMKI